MLGYKTGSINVETSTEHPNNNGFFFECKTITDIEPIRKQGLTEYCIYICRRGYAGIEGIKWEGKTSVSVEIDAMWGGWYDFDTPREAVVFLRAKLKMPNEK